MKSRYVLAAVALAVALAVSAALRGQGAKPPVNAPGKTATPDTVAARVGPRVITLADIDAAWQKKDPGSRNQLMQQLYEHRRNVLDALVAEALFEQAAKAKQIDTAAFVAGELERRKKPVADADVDAFYGANRERMQGQPLEAIRGPIRRFLEQQANDRAREALVKDLKAADPGVVSVTLDPPRVAVAVKPEDPVRGPKDAPIEIVEFSDFECPFCGRLTPTLNQVMDTYSGRVRLVFKDFPLPNHAHAQKAAEAAQCAGNEGKFWEMHDRLFGNQQALGVDALKQHAVALGLDATKFNACLDGDDYRQTIQEDMAEGQRLGISSTPSIFINGRIVVGAQPFEQLKTIIDEELERSRTRK